MVGGKASMLKGKVIQIQMGGDIYVCVMEGGYIYQLEEFGKKMQCTFYEDISLKLRIPYIWNLLIVNICGNFHTCLIFPTHVW